MEEKKPVHILLSCDLNWLKCLLVTMNSILKNTSDPKRLFFHLLVDQENSLIELEKMLQDTLLKKWTFTYEIKVPNPDAVKVLEKNIRVSFDRIGNIMNFARFLFPSTFPDVNKMVYVDIDMVFQDDIIKLFETKFGKGKYLLAIPDKRLEKTMSAKFLKNYKLDPRYQAFNAGLFVTKLDYWREKNMLGRIQDLMVANKKSKEPFFQFGTQPLMNVVFYKKYQHLHKLWQVKDLGWKGDVTSKLINQGYVLHWNGPAKGWYANGLYQKYWDKYQLDIWKNDPKPITPDFSLEKHKKKQQNKEKKKSINVTQKNTKQISSKKTRTIPVYKNKNKNKKKL